MRVLVNYPSMTDSDLAQLQAAVPGAEIAHAKSADEAVAAAEGAEVVLGLMQPEVFARADSLKWFQSASAGLDNVLFPELVESDVILTNMAGFVRRRRWRAGLGAAPGLGARPARCRSQPWCRASLAERFPLPKLPGTTMLVLGHGRIWAGDCQTGCRLRSEHVLSLDPERTKAPGVAEIQDADQGESSRLSPSEADVVIDCLSLDQGNLPLDWRRGVRQHAVPCVPGQRVAGRHRR